MKRKKRKTFLAVLAVLLAVLTAGLFFIRGRNQIKMEEGQADAATALASMADLCGKSYVETLASIKEAARMKAPEKYLAENSVFVLDSEAVEKSVSAQVSGAESTASAKNLTYEQLIVETWGYESVDAYRDAQKESIVQFIKERLSVYKAAEEMNLRITKTEYEGLLLEYAKKFGYVSVEAFTYACTPATIASEMLYEKTLAHIRDER